MGQMVIFWKTIFLKHSGKTQYPSLFLQKRSLPYEPMMTEMSRLLSVEAYEYPLRRHHPGI